MGEGDMGEGERTGWRKPPGPSVLEKLRVYITHRNAKTWYSKKRMWNRACGR